MNKEQKQTKQEFDLFDTIWEKVVVPTIRDKEKTYRGYGYISKRAKKKARRWFYNEEQIFVYSYMVDTTRNIDRHKIASCMIKAILISKPFRVSFFQKAKQVLKNIKVDEAVYLMNQYIALNVAIIILEGYIASDEDKEIKHSIYFPEPFPEGPKDYIKDVCLDLYYTNPKKINIITYANIFFLWEKYSCRKVQGDNLSKELEIYLKKDENIADVESKIREIRMRSEENVKNQSKTTH